MLGTLTMLFESL